MNAKLYVGNLSWQATDEDIKSAFSKYGNLVEASVVRDRFSGRSKGFAFVRFENSESAEKALELNGQDFMGRKLMVSEAREQTERTGGGRDFGGDRGGDRGGRGGFGGGDRGGDRGGRGGYDDRRY
ncbi:MAG TPA: RNA-binding protein [Candidatus Omnitrophota bacterium]|nr:RNA-binding protein [Candidatus Omnitrophota bacterium]